MNCDSWPRLLRATAPGLTVVASVTDINDVLSSILPPLAKSHIGENLSLVSSGFKATAYLLISFPGVDIPLSDMEQNMRRS